MRDLEFVERDRDIRYGSFNCTLDPGAIPPGESRSVRALGARLRPPGRPPFLGGGPLARDHGSPVSLQLSVVIPFYDEEENVAPLLAELRPVLDGTGPDLRGAARRRREPRRDGSPAPCRRRGLARGPACSSWSRTRARRARCCAASTPRRAGSSSRSTATARTTRPTSRAAAGARRGRHGGRRARQAAATRPCGAGCRAPRTGCARACCGTACATAAAR